jgi:hypothetical protein
MVVDDVSTVTGAVDVTVASGAADVVGVVVVVVVVVVVDASVVVDSCVVVLVASVPSLEHAVRSSRVIEHAAARRRGDANW